MTPRITPPLSTSAGPSARVSSSHITHFVETMTSRINSLLIDMRKEIRRSHEEHRMSVQRSYKELGHDQRELTLKVEIVEQA